MPTYLDLTVFEFPIDWQAAVNVEMEYDLRALQIGFGPEVFGPTQSHVAHGFAFTIEPAGYAEVEEIETFLTDQRGSLESFWLPGPQRVFQIAAGVDASTFDIVDQDFAETWEDHPSQYIRFTKSGETAQNGKISSVTDQGTGFERIVLEDDLDVAVDATWRANRLHLVRIVGDVAPAEFIGEQRMRCSFRVVELPTKYAAPGSDFSAPLYLYHFSADFNGTVVHWRFTSFDSDQESNEETFTSAPIDHGPITKSMRADRSNVTITALHDPDGPFASLFPLTMSRPLEVEILKATVADPDTTTTLFAGRVGTTQVRGPARIMNCASWLDAMGQNVPAFWLQPLCNYRVYEANTCRVNVATFTETGAISVINGRTITVTGAGFAGKALNHFANGWIRTGSGAALEEIGILTSTAAVGTTVQLVLSAPLVGAVVSSTIYVIAGCDGHITTCNTKFSNLVNFGGVSAPKRNLALQAIRIESDAAKK